MNGFEVGLKGNVLGLKGEKIVKNWYRENGWRATDLGREWQVTHGDLLVESPQGDIEYVEVKTEFPYTGNLFLETWSNRGTEYPDKLGWIHHIDKQDKYLYLNLEKAMMYEIDPQMLKKFWKATRSSPYPEKKSALCEQGNQPWGEIVPIEELFECNVITRKIYIGRKAVEMATPPAKEPFMTDVERQLQLIKFFED